MAEENSGIKDSENQPEVAAEKPATAEENLRVLLDALIEGKADIFLEGLSSKGYVDLIHIFPMSEKAELKGFAIGEREVIEDGESFPISLTAPPRPVINGKVTMRWLRNMWKIDALKVPGLRE